MKQQVVKLLFTILFSTVGYFTVQASDGVVITLQSKDVSSSRVTSSKVYMTSSMLKIDNSGAENSSILYDASQKVFTYIDNRKKEYYQFDEPTLEKLKDQIKMMVMMLKQFSSSMPEEQQRKIDQMLNGNGSGNMTYEQVGTAKIKSWKTEEYLGKSDGETILSMNLASFQTIGVNEKEFAAMKSLIEFFQNNLQEVASMLPTGKSMSMVSFDDNSPILKNGFPIKTVSYESGSAKTETLTESVSKKDIQDALFAIPAGYARKTIDIQKQLTK